MAWVRSCCRISVYLFLSRTTPASCCLASSSTEATWSSRCFNTFSLAWNCVYGIVLYITLPLICYVYCVTWLSMLLLWIFFCSSTCFSFLS